MINSLVPMVIDKENAQERSYDIYSLLLKNRIVFCLGEVNDGMANLIVAQLFYLESISPEEPIYMYIQSPGGSVTAGMAIHDTMRFIKSPVHTIVQGHASSMGAFLAASGEKGCRSAQPNARIMIHQPLSGYQGQITDMQIHVAESQFHKDNLNALLAEYTGQTIDVIERDTNRDNFMSSQQAKDYGLVDHVFNNVR